MFFSNALSAKSRFRKRLNSSQRARFDESRIHATPEELADHAQFAGLSE